MQRFLLIGMLACGLATWTSPCDADPLPITWWNYTGWNHPDVSSSGQTFTDVFQDADVDVRVFGDADRETHASASEIVSVNYRPGTQMFVFDFSEPLPLVVELQSTDATEQFSVVSPGSEDYTHNFGAYPTIETIPDGVRITGNGFRITPTGAARGLIYLSPVDNLTVMHTALRPNKYERFRIGVVTVPEPQTGLLALLGSVLWGLRRRRQGSRHDHRLVRERV